MQRATRYIRNFTQRIQMFKECMKRAKCGIQEVFVQWFPNPMELHIWVIEDWGGVGEGSWQVWS